MSRAQRRAFALDLGSTRLKLAALDASGALEVLAAEDAPATREDGLECDFDAEALDAAVERLLAHARPLELPLAIACQRSTFVAWRARDRRVLGRALSWRDRRAQPWCETHAAHAEELTAMSGLRLSPHYLGPKLAVLARAGLFEGPGAENVRVGTLESFVIARRSPPDEAHVTDVSMAARTLLLDVRTNAWSRAALQLVGAPLSALPRVLPSVGRAHALAKAPCVRASLSDQAAAFLAVARPGASAVLVNLGTGGFVLRECEEFRVVRGYLCGPLLASPGEPTRWALEGTVNAGAAGLEQLGGASEAPQSVDPQPEVFCAPEQGLGAPHWRAERTLTFSRSARELTATQRRRAYLEGLLFRVAEIVDDLDPTARSSVLLSGGVARDPFVAPALAQVLARPLELLDEPESTLLGAARLAAGLPAFADPRRQLVAPTSAPWLLAKRARWRRWRDEWLSRPAN